jgi:hypothetical protein
MLPRYPTKSWRATLPRIGWDPKMPLTRANVAALRRHASRPPAAPQSWAPVPEPRPPAPRPPTAALDPTRSGPVRSAATPGPTARATPAARPGPLHPTRLHGRDGLGQPRACLAATAGRPAGAVATTAAADPRLGDPPDPGDIGVIGADQG